MKIIGQIWEFVFWKIKKQFLKYRFLMSLLICRWWMLSCGCLMVLLLLLWDLLVILLGYSLALWWRRRLLLLVLLLWDLLVVLLRCRLALYWVLLVALLSWWRHLLLWYLVISLLGMHLLLLLLLLLLGWWQLSHIWLSKKITEISENKQCRLCEQTYVRLARVLLLL